MKTREQNCFYRLAAALVLMLVLLPANAFAYRIYSPNVTPGETAVGFWGEVTGEGNSNNKPSQKRITLEVRHTFDRLDLGLAAVGESGANGPGESIGYSRARVRGVYQVTEKGSHWFDFGIYADYQFIKSTITEYVPDNMNIYFLFEKDYGSWYLNFNPGIRRNMTKAARGASHLNREPTSANLAQYTASVKYRFHEIFNPGIEVYGIYLGEWERFDPPAQQITYVGPAAHGNLFDWEGYTLHYEGAILAGITPDAHNVLVNGVIELRF